MVQKRINMIAQSAVICLLVLSLFSSAMAACVCSHHGSEKDVSSANEHSHDAAGHEDPTGSQASTHDHHSAEAETPHAPSCGAGCVCVRPAPKSAAKPETVTLKHGGLPVRLEVPSTIDHISEPSADHFAFAGAASLSDPGHQSNLTRGPPAPVNTDK